VFSRLPTRSRDIEIFDFFPWLEGVEEFEARHDAPEEGSAAVEFRVASQGNEKAAPGAVATRREGQAYGATREGRGG